jgi:hypothetical protein
MALINLRDYFFDENGVGVGGIEVNAYPKNTDGSIGGTAAASTTSASVTGKWELNNLDTAGSPQTGVFALRFRNISTGQIRWRMGDVRYQVGLLTGADGAFPFPDGQITAVKMAAGAGTDTVTGTRTVDDAIATAFSDTGTLTQLHSWFGKALRAITEEDDWYDSPDITLADTKTITDSHTSSIALLDAHAANTSNPHSTTAAQVTAVANAGNAVKLQSGTTAARPSAASAGNGAIYVSTDDQLISYSNGTIWTIVGVATYDDLGGTPSAGVGWGTFAVSGQSNVVADTAGDTVTFIAGSGITITTNATNDSVTITNSASAGNSFGTVAVSGQSNVVADQANDTLSIAAGSGITITTTPGTDTVTITNSASAGFAFGTINVAGQTSAVADQANDTLTLVAGHGVDLTTSGDSVTIEVDETELTIDSGIDNASGKVEVDDDGNLTSTTRITTGSFASLPAGTYLFTYFVQAFSAGEDGFYMNLSIGGVDDGEDHAHYAVGAATTKGGSWLFTLGSISTVALRARLISGGTSVSFVNSDNNQFMYVRLI